MVDRLAGGPVAAPGADLAAPGRPAPRRQGATRRRADRLVGRHERPRGRSAARSGAASRRRSRRSSASCAALGRDGEAGLPIEIELVGAPGSGRTTLAAQAAARLGVRLVAVDAAALAARADAAAAATREARRARLDGSVLAWEHAEALPAELRAAIPEAPLTFLSVQVPVADAAGYRSIRRSVRCGPIGRRERLRLWSSLAATPAPAAVADWALRPAEIGVAARVAPAGDHEVGEVCRTAADGRHPGAAEPAAAAVRVVRPRPLPGHGRAPARVRGAGGRARPGARRLGLRRADLARPRHHRAVRGPERHRQDDGRAGPGPVARARTCTASTSPGW